MAETFGTARREIVQKGSYCDQLRHSKYFATFAIPINVFGCSQLFKIQKNNTKLLIISFHKPLETTTLSYFLTATKNNLGYFNNTFPSTCALYAVFNLRKYSAINPSFSSCVNGSINGLNPVPLTHSTIAS